MNLRVVVLTWTVLTTTFLWTSTMRMVFKPDISAWSIFNVGGQGFEGDFLIPPLIAIIALFTFYLEGRGRLRKLYHFILIVWHLLLTVGAVYGSFQPDLEISFGTWGIKLALGWLAVPIAFFLFLAIVLVVRERKGAYPIPTFDWAEINRQPLIIAIALTVVSFIFFQIGTGFNWLVKIAVGAAIIQWILLAEALGRPYSYNKQNTSINNSQA